MTERSAQARLVESWRAEETRPFAGWDFSYLDGRVRFPQMPWSYEALATALMATAKTVLDVGTGGGERLLAMRAAWPATVVATEDWPPNVALAHERLAPLGVSVVAAQRPSRAPLPFAAASFDLVINRHTGFYAVAVWRVLQPSGRFLTQQVDVVGGRKLQEAMGRVVKERPTSFALALHYLRTETDFRVERAEPHVDTITFRDVGALVYYLVNIPWIMPGFSVDSHLPHLLALQDQIERGEQLTFQTRHYLLQVQKPETSGVRL